MILMFMWSIGWNENEGKCGTVHFPSLYHSKNFIDRTLDEKIVAKSSFVKIGLSVYGCNCINQEIISKIKSKLSSYILFLYIHDLLKP